MAAGVVEALDILCFAVVPSVIDDDRVAALRSQGLDLLTRRDGSLAEIFRAPCLASRPFLEIARHPMILSVTAQLIPGRVILNQQNLVCNPGGRAKYSQSRFHRDFPYQHFTSSRPLGINVLVALDEFTLTNGATRAIPASHKVEYFPSDGFVSEWAAQVLAPAGSFIFLNTMTYHAGGENQSANDRLAVNNVYTSPLIRTQVDFRQEAAPGYWESLSEDEIAFLHWERTPDA